MKQEPDHTEWEAEWEAGALRHAQALTLFAADRLEAAEQAAREALCRLEAALPGGHLDSANAADTLASILAARNQIAPAVDLWRHALCILDGFRHEEVAARMRLQVLHQLGYALTQVGDYAGAHTSIQEAIDVAEGRFGDESIALATSLNLLGVLYKFQGRYDEAGAAYQKAGALFDKDGKGRPAVLLHNLAGLACARGDYASALSLAREAIQIRREAAGEASILLGTELAGLGDALAGLDRFAEAAAAYREALEIYARAGRGDHPEFGYALHNLADALADQGEFAAAARCYGDSILRKEAAFGPDHHEVAASLNNLAALHWKMGRRDEALACSDRAVRIVARLAADHPVRKGCEALAKQLHGFIQV